MSTCLWSEITGAGFRSFACCIDGHTTRPSFTTEERVNLPLLPACSLFPPLITIYYITNGQHFEPTFFFLPFFFTRGFLFFPHPPPPLTIRNRTGSNALIDESGAWARHREKRRGWVYITKNPASFPPPFFVIRFALASTQKEEDPASVTHFLKGFVSPFFLQRRNRSINNGWDRWNAITDYGPAVFTFTFDTITRPV